MTPVSVKLHIDRWNFIKACDRVERHMNKRPQGRPSSAYGIYEWKTKTVHINLAAFHFYAEDFIIDQVSRTIEHEVLHDVLAEATGSVCDHHKVIKSGYIRGSIIKDEIGGKIYL